MIIKNPSAAVKYMDSYVPKWNADGQRTIKAVALVKTTAMVWMNAMLTDSGYGIAAIASTDISNLCVPLESVASGEYVECVIEGYLEGVRCCSSSLAGSCTAQSTYTKGNYVWMSDTGVVAAGTATWTATCGFISTTPASTCNAAIGVALSSGETASLDMWLYYKPILYCPAT